MHTLDTYDLVLNGVVVVMMPLIIWANLRDMGLKSPIHALLWSGFPGLMRTSLVMLALITAYSATELLAHFGLISAGMAELAGPVFGVPFLVLSVAMIWLAAKAALKVLRAWRGGPSAT
jgi:hypothetical protein